MVVIHDIFQWEGKEFELYFDFHGPAEDDFSMKIQDIEHVLGYSLAFLNDDPKYEKHLKSRKGTESLFISWRGIIHFWAKSCDQTPLEEALIDFIALVSRSKAANCYQVKGKHVDVGSMNDFYRRKNGWYLVTDKRMEQARTEGKFANRIQRQENENKTHIIRLSRDPSVINENNIGYICAKCRK